MNIKENFKDFGKVDIQDFLIEIGKITEEQWDGFTWRQDKNPMHSASKTLPIIYDNDFRHFNGTKHELHDQIDFPKLIDPIVKKLEQEYNWGYVVRAVFVRLPAGKSIKSHIDVGGSYNLSHRVHIPLICEWDKVEYIVEDESRYFEIGQMFELNNMRQHAVHNNGSIDRINLLFDFAEFNGKGWWY
jgi:hypothetical protein